MNTRRFDTAACRDGWREDMRYGLIYPACQLEDGRIVSWRAAMAEWQECRYCRAPLYARDARGRFTSRIARLERPMTVGEVTE